MQAPKTAGWFLVTANLNGTYLAFQCKVWAYSADDAKQKFTGFVLGVRKFNAAELVVTVTKAVDSISSKTAFNTDQIEETS